MKKRLEKTVGMSIRVQNDEDGMSIFFDTKKIKKSCFNDNIKKRMLNVAEKYKGTVFSSDNLDEFQQFRDELMEIYRLVMFQKESEQI